MGISKCQSTTLTVLKVVCIILASLAAVARVTAHHMMLYKMFTGRQPKNEQKYTGIYGAFICLFSITLFITIMRIWCLIKNSDSNIKMLIGSSLFALMPCFVFIAIMCGFINHPEFEHYTFRVRQRYLYTIINFLNNMSAIILLVLLWNISTAPKKHAKVKKVSKSWDDSVRDGDIR